MKINDFKLERYFAIHEFSAKYLMSCSDCDGFKMSDILKVADEGELEMWDNLHLGYTESTGNPELKNAILRHYNVPNSIMPTKGLGAENILVSSPGELAFSLMNVLLTDKDHAIVISPSYQSLYEVINSLGCDISFWKPDEEEWRFKVSDLQKLIKPNTKLLVINFPHNPTGTYLKMDEYRQIIQLARENNFYIYSDEMYYKLNYLPDYPVLPPVATLYEKGISLWGMSKSFGMAGLRTGWLASQDVDLLGRIASFKDYLSICSSAPSEILSIIALNHSEQFIPQNIAKIQNNIAAFKGFLDSSDTASSFFAQFTAPKAGSVAFVRLNTKGSSLDFSNHLVKSTGIMTVPSEMFDFGSGFIRIGFGRRNFPQILELLKH